MPSTKGLPNRGKPGMAAWDALPGKTRDAINRVGANVGKAIEAFERTILCEDTRFDRWAAGNGTLTERELRGARVFVENGCDNCHSGPAFSDGDFHNIGIPSTDPGRAEGRELLLADDFNGAGIHSDNPALGLARLAAVSQERRRSGRNRSGVRRRGSRRR